MKKSERNEKQHRRKKKRAKKSVNLALTCVLNFYFLNLIIHEKILKKLASSATL